MSKTQHTQQAHPWHGIPTRPAAKPNMVNVYVEIVPTDGVKYELDKESGHLKVDRPQRYSSFSPTLYGFIPKTYCGMEVGKACGERIGRAGIVGDGDPMDICVLTEKTFVHGAFLCVARPVGGFRLVDGNQADDKIIAVLEDDLAYGQVRTLGELPTAIVDRIRHYFLSYKRRPADATSRIEIPETYDAEEAVRVIDLSTRDYGHQFG
jgi:inorganic pyrophosphatase